MSSQLVAFSGFSATNYIQEPYSADLDFGVGEFSVGAWVKSLPQPRVNLLEKTEDFTASAWTKMSTTVTPRAAIAPDGSMTADRLEFQTIGNVYQRVATVPQTSYIYSVWLWVETGTFKLKLARTDATTWQGSAVGPEITLTTTPVRFELLFTTGAVSASDVSFGTEEATPYKLPVAGSVLVWHPQLEVGTAKSIYQRVNTVTDYGPDGVIAQRAAATGPSLQLSQNSGRLTATAFDGTTTRTVTTPATYNNGIFTKATANYTAAGKLSINVNGVEVAAVTGSPLLSLNSRKNLFLSTADFSSTAGWVFSAATLIANADAFFGTKVIPTTANTAYRGVASLPDVVAATGKHTVSVRAKAAGYDFAHITVVNSQGRATFNLVTGATTIHAGLNGTATVGAADAEGYRLLSFTLDTTSAAQAIIGPVNIFADPAASFAGDGVSGVIFKEPQSELSATRTFYQRVNTATDFNFAAVLTIGNSRTLDAPFPGSITMLKIGATVPTPEQAAWMYEQEKQMFRAGAQVTLPEASPVLDLGYDESQDKWVAVQSGHESSFTGLIRTATATPSVGNFTKVVAGSGVKALARTSTNPGVDIQIPAYGLREELVKRAEAAAKASKTLTVFDFDSVVGQTDFVLPMGWKAASVVSAGNTQREGATKNFTRLFDGFRETIRFAVAPGAAVWIRINAIKE